MNSCEEVRAERVDYGFLAGLIQISQNRGSMQRSSDFFNSLLLSCQLSVFAWHDLPIYSDRRHPPDNPFLQHEHALERFA